MKLLRSILFGFVMFITGFMLLTSSAYAANPFVEVCSSGSGSGGSTVCKNQTQVNNPITGSGSIFEKVINLVTLATGLVAVIVIIVSGIRFATSSGDPNNVSQARNTILYTVIGLAVLLLARSIIVFVINRL